MRPLSILAVVGVLAVTPSALGTARVIGGKPIDVRDAPWSVLVVHIAAGDVALCSGSIIDPNHVLTAAHCAIDDYGTAVPAASFRVIAGVTNANVASSADRRETRLVTISRVHPGYSRATLNGGDDVAVLTLSSALDLSGPTIRAIGLPDRGDPLAVGDALTFAGYGLKDEPGEIDGTLNGMTVTLADSRDCLTRAERRNSAVLLCGFSGSSAPCEGDSGGALVASRSVPLVVGVLSSGSCKANASASFTDVTAPEILEFIRGNDSPPLAPRPTSLPTLEHSTSVMQVGQTVHCRPGTWTGSPTFAYRLREASTGSTIRRVSSPDYLLKDGDAGFSIFCRVVATNDGGTGFADSTPSAVPVQNAPEVSMEATTAARGGSAVVHVVLDGWVRPLGVVTICARLSPRVGGKTCRTAAPAGARPAPVGLRIAVKQTSPALRTRVQLTASAADGRVARAAGYLTVTG